GDANRQAGGGQIEDPAGIVATNRELAASRANNLDRLSNGQFTAAQGDRTREPGAELNRVTGAVVAAGVSDIASVGAGADGRDRLAQGDDAVNGGSLIVQCVDGNYCWRQPSFEQFHAQSNAPAPPGSARRPSLRRAQPRP